MEDKNDINTNEQASFKFINNKKRKRSNSEDMKDQEKSELQIFLSSEGYERESIFNDNELPPYKKEFNDLTAFQRKKIVQDFIKSKNNNYEIEDLLYLDDTNHDLQVIYTSIIVDKLNSGKNQIKRDILLEKIQKASIIIEEKTYNNIISKIYDKKIIENLQYINYKFTLIDALQILLAKKDISTINQAKKALRIKKKFHFNKWAEIGENNYYFYYMGLELFDKIEEIYDFHRYYKNILERVILLLEKEDFNNLNKDKKFMFNYLSFLILDKNSINTKNVYHKINNFLSGQQVTESDFIDLFRKGLKNDENNFEGFEYDINYNKLNKKINFTIAENRRINRKSFSYSLTKSYDIKLFNKNILNLIEKNFTTNFESNLMENTLPLNDNQLAYYQEIKPAFEENLKRILSSKAAQKFFENTYKKKYPDLIYHFNREDVQKEIIDKIYFFPIFKENDNGFTNPIDMSIVINSIPGKILNPKTHCFNRKFLSLGMILVIALHEILGHYLRRYYSMLTGRKICFSTNDDAEKITGGESGSFVESEFLGIEIQKSNIGLNKCLGLLCSENFDNYPVLEKDYSISELKVLENIYNNNKKLFGFIIDENCEINKNIRISKSNKKETTEKCQDSNCQTDRTMILEDYLDILIDVKNISNSFKHCNSDELYFICFDKINDCFEY